ncbi:alpha/beta fold hydrolase [Mycolicibacterium baixiangningiae]|uniref:alpha/beta fold hydrolase n=1 Tax=Mycolicibacterium baixiangningiae TaxID=2761578 RepID=UPI0018686C53|nr:alpha/beta hydrolase [Mycolicibacterium baixiangningiae]
MNKSLLAALGLMAAAAMTAGCGGAAAEQPAAEGNKPTVVLVHGAFADSSSWNGVIKILESDGYPVIAAANPLRGLQPDADYVRSILDSVSGPVVLAGHSYGGSVMSEAADGHPNVKALVYIASFILEAGESTGQLAGKFPGAQLGSALRTVKYPLPGGGLADDLYIRSDEFQRVFAADVPADVAALMATTQRPIAAAALEDPATKTAWKTIPSWNMVTLQDLAIPADSMRFMGERANAQNVEIEASHAVTVSQPAAVADLIDTAAGASTT